MSDFKNEEIKIILPTKIAVLKSALKQDIVSDREEFNIYFKNIIYPYSETYEIDVKCDYGRNLGNCWRIDEFTDIPEEFELTIAVYAPYGKKLSQKSTRIRLFHKQYKEKVTLLCIGDSMTRSEYYVEQAVNKAKPLKTIGSRSIDLNVRHDGMGGWRCIDFFTRFHDEGSGVSQFLFPKGIPGKLYYGDKLFWDKCADPQSGYYSYRGFTKQDLTDGMYVYDDGLKLMRNKQVELISENCEFEFSLEKYLERMGEEKPDIVSVLFGSNELQPSTYKTVYADVEELINTLKKLIHEIKRAGNQIKIIVNLPPCGAGQYAWGMTKGCAGTAKCYDFAVKLACERMIEEFDNHTSEGIYICPMVGVCDPEYGFEDAQVKANLYSTATVRQLTNWVHPNITGYKQMGDALAATIAMIRSDLHA